MDRSGQHPSPGRSQYTFLRRLATGGMAELYLGEVAGVGGVRKRVALKRMLPAHKRDQDFLMMFLGEARTASTLQHPNIVQTYDVIQSGDEYIIVMEYLEGADLQQFRRRAYAQGDVLALDHILYIVRSVLLGLNYAHDRLLPDGTTLGIVHRDVSPQNVFLTYDGSVKLLDFGIAKTDQNLSGTESGVLKGKVLYMAPEQCGGGEIDRRTDLYALGVVLYQLLTGTVPHRGKNAYDTMRSIIDQPVPTPRHINPQIPADLEAIVMRVLEKRPSDRYATALEMLADLETFARSQGLFTSTVGFSSLVEEVLGPRPAAMSNEALVQQQPSLPSIIEVSTSGAHPAPKSPSDSKSLETDHAIVRSIGGVVLVSLFGTLDERFDATPLMGHLRGEVVIDTNEVKRITSYGIRSLLSMMSGSRSKIEALYHVRCSVAFINQVTMIRGLLGGGRILSFQAPFIDAATGAFFAVTLEGDQARRAVQHHELPRIPSPSDPSRPAEFDDDPSLYLTFHEDFLADPPNRILQALRNLDDAARKLDVELSVEGDATIVTVRRPIRSDARWRRIMRGLEGRVLLDLAEVQSTSPAGADAFVDALESVALGITRLDVRGSPPDVAEGIVASTVLRSVARIISVQIDARCRDCGTERRTLLAMERVRQRGPIDIPSGCGRCGGTLLVISEYQDLETLSGRASGSEGQTQNLPEPQGSLVAPPPPTASRGGCMRKVLSTLLIVGLGALLSLVG